LLIFNFILKHVPRIKMEKIDRLNRRLNWKVRVKKNNENQTLIKKQWIHSITEVVIERLEVDILEK